MKIIIGRDAADWVEACGMAKEAIEKGEEVCEIENPEDGGRMTVKKYGGEFITPNIMILSMLFECGFDYDATIAMLKAKRKISILCSFEKKPRGFKTISEYQDPLKLPVGAPFAVQLVGWEGALDCPASAVPVFVDEKKAKGYKKGPFVYVGKPWKGFPERYALAVYEWGAPVLRREMMAEGLQRR